MQKRSSLGLYTRCYCVRMFAAYTGNEYCTPVRFFVLSDFEKSCFTKHTFLIPPQIVMFSSKVGRRRRCHNCRRPCCPRCPHCTRCCRLRRCCCRRRRSCRRRHRRGRPDRSLSFVFVCRRSSVVVVVAIVAVVGVTVAGVILASLLTLFWGEYKMARPLTAKK